MSNWKLGKPGSDKIDSSVLLFCLKLFWTSLVSYAIISIEAWTNNVNCATTVAQICRVIF